MIPTARAWYVKATRLDYSWLYASGPFDDDATAFVELARIQPFYPDASLDVVLHTGKSLPMRTPRSAPPDAPVVDLSLATVGDRRAAAQALAQHVRGLGCHATVEDWDGEPDVDVFVPALRGNIWLMKPRADAGLPIICWHGAVYPLRPVPGAWTAENINSYHRRKATSLPASWGALFEAVTVGLCAAVDGSAFGF